MDIHISLQCICIKHWVLTEIYVLNLHLCSNHKEMFYYLFFFQFSNIRDWHCPLLFSFLSLLNFIRYRPYVSCCFMSRDFLKIINLCHFFLVCQSARGRLPGSRLGHREVEIDFLSCFHSIFRFIPKLTFHVICLFFLAPSSV